MELAHFNKRVAKELKEMEEIKMRCGIHKGDIVCGVIGITRPRFQVWGSTCLIAELLEQSCTHGEDENVLSVIVSHFFIAGYVHVSCDAFNSLSNEERKQFITENSRPVEFNNSSFSTIHVTSRINVRDTSESRTAPFLGQAGANRGDNMHASVGYVPIDAPKAAENVDLKAFEIIFSSSKTFIPFT